MYSRQQASQIKQDFWTRFGQYMKPVQSATGEKVNWPNYKTGLPHVYFRLRAENNQATVSIELTHPNDEIRREVYSQLLAMRPMIEEALGEGVEWIETAGDEYGKPLSRIFITLDHVNIFRETDWPAMISFFKAALIGLDTFWADARAFFA